jgi:hypothetical protein
MATKESERTSVRSMGKTLGTGFSTSGQHLHAAPTSR